MADGIKPVSLTLPPEMQSNVITPKRAPLSPTHSLPAAPSETYRPSKPKIPAPPVARSLAKSRVGDSLKRFIDAIVISQEKVATHNLEQVRRLTERMGELELDKIHEVSKKAEKTFEKDTWDFYRNIAYCLSSATSIIVGGALCSTGQAPLMYLGGALIGSSIGSLSAQFLESKGVPKEVCGAIALASAGLGMIGSAGGMMYNPGESKKLIMSIVYAVTALTSGMTQYKVNDAQANMQEIESIHGRISEELRKAGVESDISMAETQESMKRFDATRSIQNAARDYSEAMTKIAGQTITSSAG